MTPVHKTLDLLQHVWPYISGVFLSFIAVFRMWWIDRKKMRRRMNNLEILAENSVSHKDLQACRDDVRAADEKNLMLIFSEIKSLREEHNADAKVNAQQHMDILNQVVTGDKQ